MNFYRFVLCLFFFSPFFSNGQDTVYFDRDWYAVEKENANRYTTIDAVKNKPKQYFVRDFSIDGSLLAEYQYKGLFSVIDWTRIYEKGFQLMAVEDGFSCQYFPSGKKRKELFYEDGVQKGLINIWNENGEIERSYYAENNVANGAYTRYFKNGNINFTVNFKKDTLEGNAIYYHENGKIAKLGKFKDGEKDGKWQYISEEGRPIAEEIYKSTFFIEGPNVNVSFPKGKWYLADRFKEDACLNFLFARIGLKDFEETEEFPSCLIRLDRVENELSLNDYSFDRKRDLTIKIERVITKEMAIFSLPNTMAYIGTLNEKDENRSVYVLHTIQNGIGMELILDCEKKNYEALKNEFLFVLKSLKKK